MADQQAQGQQEQGPEATGSFYPPPPYFWESFTPEKLAQLEELRDEQNGLQVTAGETSKTAHLLNLPTELRFLQPPPPPTDGAWQCFGSNWTLKDELPSLQEMGTEQLYSPPASPTGTGKFTQHTDRAFVLKKIAKSLLLNFLELIGILGVNPDQVCIHSFLGLTLARRALIIGISIKTKRTISERCLLICITCSTNIGRTKPGNR